ncbi:hypothetical protein TWF718_006612 [Orbilia javanica]|uniref:Uncharacterized protein n=1 Tax=Orbilia javanica TaxID=47235 RepID=A0AAN8N1F2_9PEZI
MRLDPLVIEALSSALRAEDEALDFQEIEQASALVLLFGEAQSPRVPQVLGTYRVTRLTNFGDGDPQHQFSVLSQRIHSAFGRSDYPQGLDASVSQVLGGASSGKNTVSYGDLASASQINRLRHIS